jgi:hypothetical protein
MLFRSHVAAVAVSLFALRCGGPTPATDSGPDADEWSDSETEDLANDADSDDGGESDGRRDADETDTPDDDAISESLDSPDGETDAACDPLGAVAALDCDRDGVPNGDDPDDDDDGVPDMIDYVVLDCTLRDCDGDGRADGCDTDADGDELCDRAELDRGTDPCNFDSDGDGIPDGYEVRLGLDPLATTPTPIAGVDLFLVLMLRGRTVDTCCTETSETGEVTIVATTDAAEANVVLDDPLPSLGSLTSTGFLHDVHITAVDPPGGATVTGPTTVTDLRAGTSVHVQATSGWPDGEPYLPCALAFLVDLRLEDSTGSAVSDEARVVIDVQVALESGEDMPTHICGLVPECPPREW